MPPEADRLLDVGVVAELQAALNEAASSARYWRAVNAKGQSASPGWRSSSTTSSALEETMAHGRCQPTPCSECGVPATLARVE